MYCVNCVLSQCLHASPLVSTHNSCILFSFYLSLPVDWLVFPRVPLTVDIESDIYYWESLGVFNILLACLRTDYKPGFTHIRNMTLTWNIENLIIHIAVNKALIFISMLDFASSFNF